MMVFSSILNEIHKDNISKRGLTDYVFTDPYPHIVIQDLFSDDFYQALNNKLSENKIGTYDEEVQGNIRHVNYNALTEEVLCWFYGAEFISFLSQVENKKIQRHKQLYPDFRFYKGKFAGIAVHNDYLEEYDPFYIGLYYMGKNKWLPGDGGELVMWRETSGNPDNLEQAKVLAPIGNTFVFMKAHENSWHNVNATPGETVRCNYYFPYTACEC